MKLKLTSDGTIHGTTVVNQDGELIEGVSFISITADAMLGVVTAQVELVSVPFEYTGDVDVNSPKDVVEYVMIQKQPLEIEEICTK